VARAFQLDESFLAKELAGHLLTQAAFADQFVREVQELLGEEAVRESILRTQMFMDALKDAVSSALEPKTQPSPAVNHSNPLETAHTPPSGANFKFRVIKGS
jgi:ABC-type iron transport system FetAB ATPase subunit